MPTQPLSRLLVAYEDYTYAIDSVVSGTGWDALYPVANLTTTQFSKSSKLTSTSASVALDLGSSKLIEVLSIVNHTLNTGATWRVRVSDNVLLLTDPGAVPGGQILYDSGVVNVWPDIDTYTSIPYTQYTSWATTIPNLNNPYAFIIPPEDTSAQYIHIDIDSATAGETISKLFIGPTWRPLYGVSNNWSVLYKDKSKPSRLKGANILAEATPRYKQMSFVCKYLTNSEAFTNVSLLDRYYGLTKPYLAIIDPSDSTNDYRISIYGTNSKIPAIKEAGFEGYYSKTFILDEWL